MSEEELTNYKVVLLGESNVGKTCIISRYVSNIFKWQLMVTTASNFVTKIINLKDENKTIKFEIWDTAGAERYRSLAKIFYQNANACILVYDITRKKSFEELKNYWVNEIKNNTRPNTSKNIYIIIIIIFLYK